VDPLEKLHDIQLPEPISQYPIAIGYWLLLAIILLLVVFTFKKVRQHQNRVKIKKQAIHRIQHHTLSNKELVAMLKWVCLHYFPRQACASLYGLAFQQFLVKSLPEKYRTEFIENSSKAMSSLYQPTSTDDGTEDESFKNATLLWLNKALPVNHKLMKNNEVIDD
jgi:branched-subunit amino acid transport protein AzlD